MSSEGYSPRAHSSLSVETTPSVSLDLNDFSPNVIHFLAGTRDTSQGVDSEALLYVHGSGHAQSQQTFDNQFHRTYSNRSLTQNYALSVQTSYNDDQQKSIVPGNEHPPVAPVMRQPHHLPSISTQDPGNSLNDSYCQLMSGLLESLSEDDLYHICDVSPIAQSAGFCNQVNFRGVDLFRYFEQQNLITPNRLDYLRRCLQAISRVDLCSLIDHYMISCLKGPSQLHSPLSYEACGEPHPSSYCQPCPPSSNGQPCLPSSYVEPHPPSLYENERPPPYNPEFQDPMLMQSPSDPAHSSMNAVYSGHNVSTSSHQDCSQPTQVADDEHNESQTVHEMSEYHNQWQVDTAQVGALMLQNKSKQSHEYNTQQLHHLLQQAQSELNSEKEKSQQRKNNYEQRINNYLQIIDHYAMQVDRMSGQLQGKTMPLVERYQMNRRPHGIAVIINNSHFCSRNCSNEDLLHRKGSDVDEHNLCITWEYLRYDVRIFRNLTASQITRELMQIALQSHENYDSFVCCILSHGDQDVVFGVDNQAVKIIDLANLFKRSSSLCNKPKLFFIQACRGGDQDLGVPDQKDGGKGRPCDSLPSVTDFLFSFATAPGNVSWRSCRYGSWYISSLCQVFVENAPQLDLITMLTMVNNKVSEVFTNRGYKQCPAPVILLRKQVWFFGS